jgi:hypothetical protein
MTMADATPTTPITDTVTGVDLMKISIQPVPGSATGEIHYVIQETWSSGKLTVRQNTVRPTEFIACLAAFCQATPKKKFLQFLVANGYENNLTAT